MASYTHRFLAEAAIATAAIVLVFVWRLYVKRGLSRRGRLLFESSLIVLALLSVAAYFDFGWLRYGRYMNAHDVYHYYMGSKYSREHQYFDLYHASLVADVEMEKVYNQRKLRNLHTHRWETVQSVLAKSEEYKALFTPDRWEEFKRDIAYFQRMRPASGWVAMLRDKGYNATPSWNAIARAITNTLPTSSEWGMRCLVLADILLLVTMFGFIWRAFGWHVMLFTVVFFGTNYFMAHMTIKGAFLRLDWLAAVVIAVCLMKRGRYGGAGIAMAYASSARMFPALFCCGIGVKMLRDHIQWLRGRLGGVAGTRLNGDYYVFFTTFGLGVAVLFVFSVLDDGGLHLWRNFFDKISQHNSDISGLRGGFKYVFLAPVEGFEAKKAAFVEHQWLWRSILSATVICFLFLFSRVRDDEALTMGFILVFFLTAPTTYYFVMLVAPFLFFVGRPELLSRICGAAGFYGLTVLGFLLDLQLLPEFPLAYWMSAGMLILALYMVALALTAPKDLGVSTTQNHLGNVYSNSASWRGRANAIAAIVVVTVFLAFGYIHGRRADANGRESEVPGPSSRASLPTTEVTETAVAAELAFVGEVMLGRNVAAAVEAKGGDYAALFAVASTYIRTADIAFCTLSSPLTDRGNAVDRQFVFRAPPHAVEGIRSCGLDVISLANSHVLDYGTVGMEDTIRHLQAVGIRTVGLSEAKRTQSASIFVVNGLRVAFLAYADAVSSSAYPKPFMKFQRRPAEAVPEMIADDIRALTGRADIVVVSMHWGKEEETTPSQHQVALGHYIIDQGADIIAGHHQHVQQEPEVYKNGLILHGMGNFVFDQHSRPRTRESRLYRVRVNKQGIISAEYLPLEIEKGTWQPVPTSTSFVPIAFQRNRMTKEGK